MCRHSLASSTPSPWSPELSAWLKLLGPKVSLSLRREVMLGRVLEQKVTSGIFLHLCAWNLLFPEAASGAQEPSQGLWAAGDQNLPSNSSGALG